MSHGQHTLPMSSGQHTRSPRRMAAVPTRPTHEYAVERILKTFKPVDFGLDADFLLLNFTEMKGCGCKVPQTDLHDLLQAFGAKKPVADGGEIGIGLDSCVIPLRHKDLSLVQTTDFFYPLVDDPYIMGRITAANVLSDLYAMGVTDCDNMLMLLGVCRDFSLVQTDIVCKQFITGFKDAATQALTEVRGGQTVKCPWFLLGGVASSVVSNDEMLDVTKAVVGDVLILTKPLGGQVAVNAYEWLKKKDDPRANGFEADKIIRAAQQVMEQMCRLNRNAAMLARKYEAHACTDVTGFGILGHAENLARVQTASVRFRIESLPVIDYMEHITRFYNDRFGLLAGTSAETSGGLLLAMSEDAAAKFREELEKIDLFPTFQVGKVVKTEEGEANGAYIIPDVKCTTVPSTIHSPAFSINY